MIISFEKRKRIYPLLFFFFSIMIVCDLNTLVHAQSRNIRGQTKEVEIDSIYNKNDSLKVGFSLINFFTGDLLDNIHKGIPITLLIQAQLWQQRARWFDKPLDSEVIIYKLGFDTWNKIYYLIISSGSSDEKKYKCSFSNIEELNSFIDDKNNCFLYSLNKLKKQTSYYITFKINIKTLTLNDLKEVESWLKGELKTAKETTADEVEIEESFSDRMFNFALKLTGFKNQVIWEKSAVFTREKLR